jgi:ABC-type Fe3+-hydroxamate transport system substrate-binding protein
VPEVVDALGRRVRLDAPARRVVSLVPSETEAVCDLVGEHAMVGCTEYCEEPPGVRDRIGAVGGTKKFDVDAVVARAPDLVLANKEENGRKQVEALMDRGLTVHVSFPRTVQESLSFLESLAILLGVEPESAPALVRARRAYDRLARGPAPEEPLRVFAPIWLEPLMTFDGRVVASDLLALCGAHNVFSDRARRYPLAADLGRGPELSAERVGERDTRYPRVTMDEVVARAPEAVLLPDEPYCFTERDADTFRALAIPAAERGCVRLVSGKDLLWYGTRLAGSIERTESLMESLRRDVRGAS